MIKLENTYTSGWQAALRGMRNAKNSWDKADSSFFETDCGTSPYIGPNDLKLATTLANAGTDHGKFLRFIVVDVDVTMPLYFAKQLDQYKVGTVSNSCSTMHKIAAKPFERADFSHDHLNPCHYNWLDGTIERLNHERDIFNLSGGKDKEAWWQMIQMLPSSYNQRRTYQFNYAVLRNIYHARKNHKLSEWHDFCDWIETLPYAKELICGKEDA